MLVWQALYELSSLRPLHPLHLNTQSQSLVASNWFYLGSGSLGAGSLLFASPAMAFLRHSCNSANIQEAKLWQSEARIVTSSVFI